MYSFNKKLYITSDTDLFDYIKSMSQTHSELINNGKNIISYESLATIRIEKGKKKKKKTAIILNSNQQNDNNIGHWCIILIDSSCCLFIDSLNHIFQHNPLICKNIKNFCLNNQLKLINWNLQTQQKQTNICGFQVIFYLNYFKNNSIDCFTKLRKLLATFSIKNRELFILKSINKIL